MVYIGLDAGTSAVKVAALKEDGSLLFTQYTPGREEPEDVLARTLAARGIAPEQVAAVGLCGSGAGRADHLPHRVKTVSEFDAVGTGGAWAVGVNRAVVASLGTGTSFVLYDKGVCTHLGGTGVGGGTLQSLSQRILGISDARELAALAMTGHRTAVDLTIGDLAAGYEGLTATLTASNLAKARPDATPGDWAAGLYNLVLEVAGSMAVFACKGAGVDTVVVTGGLSKAPMTRQVYDFFSQVYGLHFFVAENGDCATAEGAARLLLLS